MNEQPPLNNPDGKDAPAEATEQQFLADQVKEASAAIGAAFTAMTNDLNKGLDPRTVTKQHPWIAVGTAVVAGFVAANAMVPSKEEQAMKKLARVERALHPQAYSDYAAGAGREPARAQEQPSMMKKVLSEVVAALKPALSSMLTMYAAKAAQQNAAGNGHEESVDGGATTTTGSYRQEPGTNQS
ncbi:MAG TPA: hypothetical protein VFE58_01430 [Tepidisphaeraceae bacterium]|nr:hypothetical protein [Tepidisphaeraceae bacterium]